MRGQPLIPEGYGQYTQPQNLPPHLQGYQVHAQPQQGPNQWWTNSNCSGKRKVRERAYAEVTRLRAAR